MLAAAHEPADLNRRGFRLYEAFRPGCRPASGMGSEGRARSDEGASLGARAGSGKPL